MIPPVGQTTIGISSDSRPLLPGLGPYLEASGHLVECRLERAALRVFPVGPGFNGRWHCSFPYHLRTEGARYLVERLTATSRGYYASGGRIYLVENGRAVRELPRRQEGA